MGNADSDNIEVSEYGSEDAKIIDADVVEAVKSQEEYGDKMLCEKCDEAQEVCMPVGEDEEGEAQRGVRGPDEPTQAMREEHELTHWPYRSWCSVCVRARARDNPSRRVSGEYEEHILPRVRMDYGFLTEDVESHKGDDREEESQVARGTMTMAVVQESLMGSVWTYAVETKGIGEAWFVEQLLDDLETIGLKNERVVIKSDQEPAIVEVMKEIQKRRI